MAFAAVTEIGFTSKAPEGEVVEEEEEEEEEVKEYDEVGAGRSAVLRAESDELG